MNMSNIIYVCMHRFLYIQILHKYETHYITYYNQRTNYPLLSDSQQKFSLKNK